MSEICCRKIPEWQWRLLFHKESSMLHWLFSPILLELKELWVFTISTIGVSIKQLSYSLIGPVQLCSHSVPNWYSPLRDAQHGYITLFFNFILFSQLLLCHLDSPFPEPHLLSLLIQSCWLWLLPRLCLHACGICKATASPTKSNQLLKH